jgi:hypothetical protein
MSTLPASRRLAVITMNATPVRSQRVEALQGGFKAGRGKDTLLKCRPFHAFLLGKTALERDLHGAQR